MKYFLIIFVCTFLVSCSSTPNILYKSPCFDSQEEAANVGREIFNMGFNNRVSYWVTGDSGKSIAGLGLMYGGFEPTPYCPNGGYPILVYFDNSASKLDIENVKSWSRVVLESMLKEMTNEQ